MSPPLRVLVADDHGPTREDIGRILDEDGRFEARWEAADAASAIAQALEERPDLCLLDVNMPGGGASAAWEISARLPDTKIVMLSVSRDETDLFAALRAGASGYLLKDVDGGRIPEALAAIVEGDGVLSGELVARLVREFRDRGPRRRSVVADSPGEQLTSREWQVLDLLREGLTTAQIAHRLVVSRATVRSHVAAIVRKLRVPDRDAAVRLFERGP